MQIRTLDEMIEALGGTSRICETFGCARTCISNWRHDGYFPAETFWLMKQEAKKARVKITPKAERDLWNWTQWGGKRWGDLGGRPNGKAKAR